MARKKKVDLRTPLQRRREERRAAIIREFEDLYRYNPGAKAGTIITHLAVQHDYSENGVRKILSSEGIYKPGAGDPVITIGARRTEGKTNSQS